MSKKNEYQVVKLSNEKTAQLTQILSNKTAKKILSQLEEKSFTESELAKKLQIPLPTIHYNIKQLVAVGLVKNEAYTYSKKGREINYYALSNNHIIISSKPSFSISFLQQIIPAILVFMGGLSLYSYITSKSSVVPLSAQRAMVESESSMMMAAEDVAVTTTSEPSFLFLFSLFFLIIVLIISLLHFVLYLKDKQN